MTVVGGDDGGREPVQRSRLLRIKDEFFSRGEFRPPFGDGIWLLTRRKREIARSPWPDRSRPGRRTADYVHGRFG